MIENIDILKIQIIENFAVQMGQKIHQLSTKTTKQQNAKIDALEALKEFGVVQVKALRDIYE